MKNDEFPARLKAYMALKGLNQSQMATLMGVRQNTISLWLAGGRKPLGSAIKLLEVLEREHISEGDNEIHV